MTADPEHQFLKFRRTGDATALAATFAAVAPELLRVAAFLLPRDEVEDAVHDTFVVAMTRQDAWDEQRPLLPWLLGVLANEARSRRRRRRQQRSTPPLATPATVDPVAAAQAAEFDADFTRTLHALPQHDAELLRLHLCDELTCREIGERLQRPAGTVRTQVSRAMSELRRRLPVAAGAPLALPMADAAMLARLQQRVLTSALEPAVRSTLGATRPRLWSGFVLAAATLVCLAAGLHLAGVFAPTAQPSEPQVRTATVDRASTAPPPPPVTPTLAGEPAPTREPAAAATVAVAPWTLRGRVHDEQGRGIVGAEIALRHGEFEPRILVTHSGANGEYSLDLAFWRDRPALDRSRGFFVMTKARGHHSYPHFGKFPPTARPDTELALAVDFELGPYPTISGRVVDPSGRPVPGLLMASDPLPNGHLYAVAHAEADGTFLLIVGDIDEGKVALTASHAKGAPFHTTLEVHQGLDTDVGTIMLLPGHAVSGQVVLRDGSAVGNCEVALRTEGVRSAGDHVLTDRDGRFTYVRPLPNAWSATLMKVSTQRGGTWGPSFPFAADVALARLEVDAALLELHWFDPDGTPLLPQYAMAQVRDSTTDEVFAEQNGELAWLLVPTNSRVRVQATTVGGCVVAQQLTAPARGRQRCELRFQRLPRAAFRVDLVWEDGTPVAEFDCSVGSAEPGQASAEETQRRAGQCEWLAPIGKVTITARGYPSMYDGGEVEALATVLADGTGAARVVIPRRGRIAITLRDIAAADRVDDDFAADIKVAGEELSHFVYTDGDMEMTSSEPPLGRKLDTLQLLPPGTHEVTVTAEGWLPAKATVEVRADQVAEIVVWLQKG